MSDAGTGTTNAAHVAHNQQQQQQQQQPSFFSGLFSNIVRMMVIMWVINAATSFFKGPQKDPATGKALPPHAPIWPIGQELSFQAFMSTSASYTYSNERVPFWREKFIYFNSDQSNQRSFSVNMTENEPYFGEFYKHLVNNGSLFVHVFVMKRGVSPDKEDASYHPNGVLQITHQINKYHKIKKSKRKNLISDTTNGTKTETGETEERYGNYWDKELYLHMVNFNEAMPHGQVYPHLKSHLQFEPSGINYYPVIYFNEFWVIRDRLLQVNETVKSVPLTIIFEPLSSWKWQIYLQMKMSFSMQQSIGTATEGQEDEMKRIFLETNPYLLAVTLVVTLLHSIFDFLAFKNDIQFWKDKKNMEGTSVKTIMLNCVFQAIILLYLLDSETNWLILISSFVGLGIEIWKLRKAVIFKRTSSFPFITFSDREDYISSTKEHDDTAIRYLFYAAIPLLIGYATYSLFYDTHKNWYSFIIGTAVGFIYTFGFIMMTPQLFINYKMKSVAHMPWKSFMYKALNTFVDDLFSFVIKMPTLHRLSCFRDDIIFFIYLYQRWIYPVDPKRSNEYGQSGEPAEQQQQQRIASSGEQVEATTNNGEQLPNETTSTSETIVTKEPDTATVTEAREEPAPVAKLEEEEAAPIESTEKEASIRRRKPNKSRKED